MTTTKIGQLIPLKVDLEIYKHIELTQDEIDLAIYNAKKEKDAAQKLAAYKEKIKTEQKYPKFHAETIFGQVKQIPGFVVDEFNRDIIWQLCLYFSEDPACKLDLNKGLLMFGPIGCGKTTLMRFFRRNQTKSFAIFSTLDVADEYAKEGSDAIQRYKTILKTSAPEEYFGQRDLGICFDDVGIEVDKNNYGNKSNVMYEIFLHRYELIDEENKKLFNKTHLTTNLDAETIGERYGDRVKSRFKEMFNLVLFNEKAPDRRK